MNANINYLKKCALLHQDCFLYFVGLYVWSHYRVLHASVVLLKSFQCVKITLSWLTAAATRNADV